ncbi:hypothetical protein [Reichenbachiella sp.]|uniref:hypothetical protein n=1 Tax=Reichenbachiella sp. TaxID=2184521 RepID=UPI003B594748
MNTRINRSADAIISLQVVVIIFTMLNNLEHGAMLYFRLTDQGVLPEIAYKIIPYIVILTLDMAIFSFMLLGDHRTAKVFAWGMFAINLLYWDVFMTIYEIFTPEDVEAFTMSFTKLLVSILFAGAFSYSIHAFSKSLKKSINFSKHLRRLVDMHRRTRAKNVQLSAAVEQLHGNIAVHLNEKSQLERELLESGRKLSEVRAELSVFTDKEEKEIAARTCRDCNHEFPDKQTMGKQRGGKDRNKCKSGVCPGKSK